MAKQGLERFECVFLHSVLGETVFGAISNRGRSYSNDLCLSLVRLETGVGAIRMICVCRWSGVKQGLARFQCLFLCMVQRETGVEAIGMLCFCPWSGAKQGLDLFGGYSNDLCLSLVRSETGVGAISMSLFVFGPA